MERKIGFIVIFSILVISNVFCITMIIRINSGLTQLEKGKEEIEARINPLIKPGIDIPKEINKQKEKTFIIIQEIKQRLSKLEQLINLAGKEKYEERSREFEKRLGTLERHESDRARSGGPERMQEIKEMVSRHEQRISLQAVEKKQIERRLDGLERHGGDQARICGEDIRKIEQRFRELERGAGEAIRELERRVSKLE